MALTVPQAIECVHLTLLEVLRGRIDPGRYVLKGGANLRYFFNSERYSEDIDFDTYGLTDWKFSDQVERALGSDAMQRWLRSAGIMISPDDITNRKNSETTQRWRVLFTAEGHPGKLRTKIEFSSRNGDERFELATVPDEITKSYAIRPPSVQHYLVQPATEQKVIALAKRPETQARDVFDLDILLRRDGLDEGALSDETRQEAVNAAIELTYQDFETQVKPFLEPAVAGHYDQTAWDQIQHYVIDRLIP